MEIFCECLMPEDVRQALHAGGDALAGIPQEMPRLDDH